MIKYKPLPQFLMSRQLLRVRLGFAEIEEILGFKLPKSAYAYKAWWRNNETGRPHARAWLSVGWRTEDVDIAGRKVTFARVEASPTQQPKTRKNDPWGCMAGSVTIMRGTDLTAPSGEQWNAEKGLLLNE